MLTPLSALPFWLLLASSAAAAQPARMEVREITPLLLAAIEAPQGRAAGVLRNADTVAIARHFGASSPVYVEVSTLARYAQPGCRRLAVRIWQEGVRMRVGDPEGTQRIEFGINYCRDGRPPASLALEAP